jgi:MFS family permease
MIPTPSSIPRNTFKQPKWRKPTPLGYGNAVESLGSIASPLLAGFSLASVIVVSDDSSNFRWPGAVVFFLAAAAVLLMGAVQCGYNARQYLWSASDVLEWWPDMIENSDRETVLREEQALAFGRWQIWTTWMRTTYNLGILALLLGLALALPPRHDSDAQADWRWAAVGFVFIGCAAEAGWIIAVSLRRFWEERRIREVVLNGDKRLVRPPLDDACTTTLHARSGTHMPGL